MCRHLSIRQPAVAFTPAVLLPSNVAKSKSRHCGPLKTAATRRVTWCEDAEAGSTHAVLRARAGRILNEKMKFEVVTKDPNTRARRGRLHTAHGIIETPV